jgi:fido (protein-threonine AMPylation protein)
MAGLKFKHIATRGQLDELEQANIVQGILWTKKHQQDDMLTIGFGMDLHKALFEKVWRWAGTFRVS